MPGKSHRGDQAGKCDVSCWSQQQKGGGRREEEEEEEVAEAAVDAEPRRLLYVM